MKPARHGYKLALLALACLAWMATPAARSQTVDQDDVTAALALQLLSFTEWPGRTADDAPIALGVFEDARLREAFEKLIEKPPFRGRFAVSLATSDTPQETIEGLHALFFPSPEPRAIPHIVKRLEGRPVALLGSFDGFLEMGGMVNFTKRQRKIAFEINLDRSRASGIEYRSKLLRLASRIIGQ